MLVVSSPLRSFSFPFLLSCTKVLRVKELKDTSLTTSSGVSHALMLQEARCSLPPWIPLELDTTVKVGVEPVAILSA